MRKIEIRVSAMIAAAMSGVISLLGFSGCRTSGNTSEETSPIIKSEGIKVMYGVPASVYKVIGDVKGPDGKPVDGASVIVSGREEDGGYLPLDTVRTGYNGEYFTGYLRDQGELKVVVRPDDTSLEPDSASVSGAELLKDRSRQVRFKLRKRK